MPKTLFEKIWDRHVVKTIDGGPSVIYIDRHFIHEVTSPQAFKGLEKRGLEVFRPKQIVATADHNVPTLDQHLPIKEELSRLQVQQLVDNCRNHDVELYGLGHPYQGIVHVIGPELGITQPGMTIVCGDSHTATHGAFGALAFGVGTSEVEHVLATQCMVQAKPKSMRIRYDGDLGFGVTAKDLILATIGQIGVAGAVGHVVEYAGPAIEALNMEGRMTVCNMTIEGGGRAGMIAPDQTTFDYVIGREAAPSTVPDAWRELRTDPGASFDTEITIDASAISPMVTWGTNPEMVVGVSDSVPEPQSDQDERALHYMGLDGGTPIEEITLDRVFIGSRPNSRIGGLPGRAGPGGGGRGGARRQRT